MGNGIVSPFKKLSTIMPFDSFSFINTHSDLSVSLIYNIVAKQVEHAFERSVIRETELGSDKLHKIHIKIINVSKSQASSVDKIAYLFVPTYTIIYPPARPSRRRKKRSREKKIY